MTLMATTSIWRVKGWLGKVVIYAENPEKTANPKFYADRELTEQDGQQLSDVIRYAVNSEKTQETGSEDGAPLHRFVSGINCSPATARDEMLAVKKRFGKEDGTVAYHGYQSFAPGEATPEQAHEIGRQLADEVLQGKYPYVLTTHIDKGHVHNHIIFCAVDMVNQRKYISNKQSYAYIRRTSDRLCKENGLSVVKPGQSNNSVQMVLTLRFMQKPRFEKSRCSCIAILVPLPMKSKRNVHFSRVAITHTTVYEMPCAGIFSLRPTLNTWKFSRFLLIYH